MSSLRRTRPLSCLLLGVVLAAGLHGQAAPTAQGGTLDLRGRNFSEHGIVELEGEWVVFWRELLEPEELPTEQFRRQAQAPNGLFDMPHTWNDWEYRGEPVGGMGYATFVVELLLPYGLRRAAIWIPNASTAYRLWVDGELLAQSGSPGTSRETSRPHYVMNTAEFPVDQARAKVLLQVSNFHHRRGGMWKPIKLGTPEQIRQLDASETTYDLLLLGSFIALALHNLFLFMGNRTPRDSGLREPLAPLLLSVAFFALVFRVFVTGQILATQLIPSFPWGLELRIEYLSAHVVFVSFAWLAERTYPGVIDRRLIWGITVFVALNSLVTLFFPVLVYSRLVTTYNIVKSVVLLAMTVRFIFHAFKGNKDAWVMVGTITIFFLITFSEMIHYREIVLSRDFAPVGAIVALLGGNSQNETVLYLVTTLATLGAMLVIFNLFVLKVSSSMLRVETRLTPLDPSTLADSYHITSREFEILRFVAQGKSNKEIGAELSIAERTVKNHLYRIMRKLDVGNRTEIAIRLASLRKEETHDTAPSS